MNRLVLLFGFVSALSTFACGKNDCEDGYERIKAKYDDCKIDTANLKAPVDGEECSDVNGESAQNLADTVESGTCESLRQLTGEE